MKLTDEELNKILMKADDDYDRMKDRLHELYEENERLTKAIEITEENWLHYMKINQKAIDYLENHIVATETEEVLLKILKGEDNE